MTNSSQPSPKGEELRNCATSHKPITSGLRSMAENLWAVERRINVDDDAELLIAAAVIIDLYEERLAQFERALRDIAYLRVPPKRVKFLQDMALRALAVWAVK